MKSRLSRSLLPLGLACLLSSATGCWKEYVRVDVAETTGTGTPEVSMSETWHQRERSIKTLAIRAPESCEHDAACELPLTELERGLAAAGYRVISWDTLRQTAKADGPSIYERARMLGADAVVLVNDLKTPRLRADEFQELSVRYRRSNPEGDDLGEATLRPETRDQLGAKVREHFVAPAPTELVALSASLDATVVLADTGEAVWFYRWTQTRMLTPKPDTSFLFRGRELGSHDPAAFRLVAPRRPEQHDEQAPADLGANDSTGQGVEASLIHDITSDLAQRLRAGT